MAALRLIRSIKKPAFSRMAWISLAVSQLICCRSFAPAEYVRYIRNFECNMRFTRIVSV